MNDDAVLYAKSNNYQRNSTKKILDEFAPFIQWRQDGCDSVLDIGCGSGDVTVELILPIIPPNFTRLIGCDLSAEMIKYAQQHYNHRKVSYEKLDIREDVDEFLRKFGLFDHILSFFCLHWVRNQKQALTSIRKLLTPHGDCLLSFVTSFSAWSIYEDMSKLDKWSRYMKDVALFVGVHESCPINEFESLCKSVGFLSYKIKCQEERYICRNFEEFKNFYMSIDPFLKRMSVDDQEEYILEILEREIEKNMKMNESKFLLTSKLIVIYAKNKRE